MSNNDLKRLKIIIEGYINMRSIPPIKEVFIDTGDQHLSISVVKKIILELE